MPNHRPVRYLSELPATLLSDLSSLFEKFIEQGWGIWCKVPHNLSLCYKKVAHVDGHGRSYTLYHPLSIEYEALRLMDREVRSIFLFKESIVSSSDAVFYINKKFEIKASSLVYFDRKIMFKKNYNSYVFGKRADSVEKSFVLISSNSNFLSREIVTDVLEESSFKVRFEDLFVQSEDFDSYLKEGGAPLRYRVKDEWMTDELSVLNEMHKIYQSEISDYESLEKKLREYASSQLEISPHVQKINTMVSVVTNSERFYYKNELTGVMDERKSLIDHVNLYAKNLWKGTVKDTKVGYFNDLDSRSVEEFTENLKDYFNKIGLSKFTAHTKIISVIIRFR